MSAPARQTIRIDAMRSVVVEVAGSRVNLSFLVAGIKAADQPIPAEVSQAIGAALMLAGRAAAGANEVNVNRMFGDGHA